MIFLLTEVLKSVDDKVYVTVFVAVCVLLAVMANVNGQVRPLKCNTGYKCEYTGQLYVRYCTKKSVKYLKCVGADCPGRAPMKNGILTVTEKH